MPIDIEKMLSEWAPVSSRDMYLNMVADSLGKASENATHAQQQIQTITVTNTALGSGLIYSIAAKGS
ncbi:hypothetical protein C0J08_20230 [Marinomonas sp. CT5]|uniref:RebB family R body protein n=1 Tax=Marinomonas sp. CT5 TaxID=2066133 RepID=UPI001846788E|nr:RebB family R body protein [Marinomonas sp. CT5]NVK72137.1 RebB family R body protein [Oceanospirillaceae bacterium]QUX97588.1 hypothetical protein C0J08_20230 [Marinomonas sp. CT5]